MKKKILITIIMGTAVTFLIYKGFYHENMNIVALGDTIATGETAYNVKGYSYNDYLRDYYEENSVLKEYITEFTNSDETTETLILKLQNNYTLESTGLSIIQAISKAKILTIALGMNELNNKKELSTPEINNYLKNMDQILKIIRIYNEKEVFLIGLYSSNKIKNEKIQEINEELKKICDTYQIKYINIENITENKDYFFNQKSYFLNYKGHKSISEIITSLVN